METKIGQIIAPEIETWGNSLKVSRLDTQELTTKSEKGELSVSLYKGETVKPKDLAVSLSRLMLAFPKMSNVFFDILSERVVANKFTSKRLNDAINYLIDNFSYKELNIADIIKFDKKVKLYSYNDVCKMVSKGEASFADFVIKEIEGTHYRVKKTDLK